MRLLVVSQYFAPENFRINDVARELVDRGHAVTVLCGTPNYGPGRIFDGYGWFRRTRESWHGVEVVRVPIVPRGAGSRLRLAANYLSYALSASLFGPMRCRGRYDAILIFQMSPATMGIAALVMKWVKSVPVLFWVQDLWPESIVATGAIRNRWLLWPIELLVRTLYRAADVVLIQSRSFRAHIESRGVSAERIRYLPNSAESFYVPLGAEQAHPALAQVPSGFRVMFAGNVGIAQDLPTLIAAADRTRDRPDIQWLIVGDGTMRAWVDSEIRTRSLGSTVHVLGRFAVQDMPRLFAGADALLVTMRRDPVLALTIPSKVQSYLASGKPILGALDGEGAAVIREARAGLCGAAEDADALVRHALALAELDAVTRQEMGRRGREYFLKHFGHGMLLERLETWCAELVAARAS